MPEHMLAHRADFRAWLARHDAQIFELRAQARPEPLGDGVCQCCGGPLGDTPSQAREDCIVCLAERFGGDEAEQRVAKALIGGMARGALSDDAFRAGLLRDVVLDAIEAHEAAVAFSSGEAIARARLSRPALGASRTG
jgi:hypothetical protein